MKNYNLYMLSLAYDDANNDGNLCDQMLTDLEALESFPANYKKFFMNTSNNKIFIESQLANFCTMIKADDNPNKVFIFSLNCHSVYTEDTNKKLLNEFTIGNKEKIFGDDLGPLLFEINNYATVISLLNSCAIASNLQITKDMIEANAKGPRMPDYPFREMEDFVIRQNAKTLQELHALKNLLPNNFIKFQYGNAHFIKQEIKFNIGLSSFANSFSYLTNQVATAQNLPSDIISFGLNTKPHEKPFIKVFNTADYLYYDISNNPFGGRGSYFLHCLIKTYQKSINFYDHILATITEMRRQNQKTHRLEIYLPNNKIPATDELKAQTAKEILDFNSFSDK
jgi:hypothetical protein